MATASVKALTVLSYQVLGMLCLLCADDHSRVTLSESSGDPPSDYINASYIQVNDKLFHHFVVS